MNNNSLLSRDEGAAYKGVAMLFIIMGHDIVFSELPWVWENEVLRYFYMFHIHAFFILPFLYGGREFSWYRMACYFVRFYWPFLVFGGSMLLLYRMCYVKTEINWGELLLAVGTGNLQFLKKYTGIQFLWFLPAFFATMVLRDLYFSRSNRWRIVLLAISVIAVAFNFFNPLSSFWVSLTCFMPNVCKAFLYLAFGVACRQLMQYPWTQYKWPWLLLFFIGSVFYFVNYLYCEKANHYSWNVHTTQHNVAQVLMPVVFVMLLYTCRKILAKSFLLRECGKYSLSIYLFSPLVGYGIAWMFMRMRFVGNVAAVVSLAGVCAGSYVVSMLIYRWKIDKLIFPKYIPFVKES